MLHGCAIDSRSAGGETSSFTASCNIGTSTASCRGDSWATATASVKGKPSEQVEASAFENPQETVGPSNIQPLTITAGLEYLGGAPAPTATTTAPAAAGPADAGKPPGQGGAGGTARNVAFSAAVAAVAGLLMSGL